MPMHLSIRRAAGITTLCATVIGTSSGAVAQGRFELVGGDAIAAMQGLSVYTIRDNRTAVCYTLFVLGALDAGSWSNGGQEPALTAGDLDKIRVAEMLKQAAAIRDRKIADLTKALGGTAAQHDASRETIDDEYETAIRIVLPQLYPSARNRPEWRSTPPAALNDAVRQAIADADAVAAAAARLTVDGEVLHLLDQMTRSPRLAVAGPLACAPATATAR